MLKNFKLGGKKEIQRKISLADISGPTHSQTVSNIKTVPIQQDKTTIPEKVIKATTSYRAQNARELSFQKGDFFHVISENGSMYQAANPLNGAKGFVPVSHFEVFGRGGSGNVSAVTGSQSSNQGHQSILSSHSGQQHGSLYAIVLYDFQAEKSDELTVYAGENLFICAHHDYDWFIAKPIGRLGGPGLVPVGFVSIIDMDTGYATGNDVIEDIRNVSLPTVQVWKSDVAKYKASNIALGTLEDEMVALNIEPSSAQLVKSASIESGLFVVSADVTSYSLEGDKYVYEMVCHMNTGPSRRVQRLYEDFYDLQVKLLDAFPQEAGKLRDPHGQHSKRILPFIPGPVPYVTETITQKRRDDLNLYVKELIALPDYISKCDLVKALFVKRKNGLDVDFDAGDRSPVKQVGRDSTDLKPTKIKFYYKDDIFALLLHGASLDDLRSKIESRVDSNEFKLFIRLGEDSLGGEVDSDEQVYEIISKKLKIAVFDA